MAELARSGQAKESQRRRRPAPAVTSDLRIAERNRRARGELRMRLSSERSPMLYWVILLAMLALITGVLGFGGVLHTGVAAARILFAVFLLLLVASIVLGAVR